MKKYILLALIVGLCGTLAGSNASPLRHVVSQFGSDCFFVMNESKDGLTSSGLCYRIEGDQAINLLWKVEGFYAWPEQLLLSMDGAVLVRVRELHQDKLDESSAVVEVYRDGVLKNSLPVSLFMNLDKIEISPFGSLPVVILKGPLHRFGALLNTSDLEIQLKEEDLRWKPEEGGLFLRLETVDGVRHIVDLTSGKVIHKEMVGNREISESPAPWDE